MSITKINEIINFTFGIGNPDDFFPLAEKNTYVLLQPYRYFLSFYLAGEKTKIGGELFIIYRSTGALLDFKYSYFEDIKKIKNDLFIKPIHITGDIKHAALLILDLKNKTYEYFDPEGYPIWYETILSAIQTFIKYFAPGFKYVAPRCGVGIQKLENEESEGKCSDWALLYLYLKGITGESTKQITFNIMNAIPVQNGIEKLLNAWEFYLWNIVDTNNFYEILIGDVLLKSRLTPDKYMNIMDHVYVLLAEKKVEQARNVIKNELFGIGIEPEYFQELVKKLPKY